MTNRFGKILLACSLLAGPTVMVVHAAQDRMAGDTTKDDQMNKRDKSSDKMPKHKGKKAKRSKKQDKMPGDKMDNTGRKMDESGKMSNKP